MTFQVLSSQKKEIQAQIVSEYRFPKANKATGVICIADMSVLQEILEGLSILPANFIIVHSQEITSSFSNIICVDTLVEEKHIGLDFMLCDNEKDKLDSFFKK